MIHLGLAHHEKINTIGAYCQQNSIKKVFIFSPDKFKLDHPANISAETIEYKNIIEYRFFYRLLQEIDASTLLVVNECLRTQNRYDLTYNCIRNFLNQTGHQLIFQYLPIIDTIDELYILVDFDTKSRWKRMKDESIIKEASIRIYQKNIVLNRLDISTSQAMKDKYEKEKKKLFDGIGLKDPHTIPRNLYLIGGKEKASRINLNKWYLGRNNRFKFPNMQTFRENEYSHSPYTIFEICHNFIDFIDYLCLSVQEEIDFMIVDLKVDDWYFERYQAWISRLNDVYSKIRQQQNRT